MRYFILLLFVCMIWASCGSPIGIPPALYPNVVDTVSLWALSGTPIAKPSGYVLSGRQAVRTDVYPLFDFVFDIDSAGRALLLPTGAVKLGRNSGLQLVTQKFDSIHTAALTNYNRDSATVVAADDVVLAHSIPLPTGCSFGALPGVAYYAKLQILTIDTTSGGDGRRIDFLILVDANCGYRGLDTGLPHN